MENIFFRVCVFCDVLLFEQGCAFFVKNDFVSSLRERRDKKNLFFSSFLLHLLLGASSSSRLFLGGDLQISLSLSLNPKSVQLYTEF